MKAIYLSFIFFILLTFRSIGQEDPYSLNKRLDGSILGASTLFLLVDAGLNYYHQPLTDFEIQNLNPEKINGLDRFAVNHFSKEAKLRSDVGMIAPMGLAVMSSVGISGLFKDKTNFSKTINLAVIGLEANLINYLITDMTKIAAGRIRPYVYNPDVDPELKLEKKARKSFFSGHTSFSAVNSFFIAKVFSDYFPDSKWKSLVWIAASVIPAWTGFERVLAGKHFPSDVISGYAVGALIGYFIPEIHKKSKLKETNTSISIGTSHNMTGISVKWVF